MSDRIDIFTAGELDLIRQTLNQRRIDLEADMKKRSPLLFDIHIGIQEVHYTERIAYIDRLIEKIDSLRATE